MSRIARVALAVVLALSLAGCGPKTIYHSLFPDRYGVRSTVVFRDGDRTVTQTLDARCTTVDQSDSIASNILTTAEGERHWLARRDGSILVMPDIFPCRWAGKDGVAQALDGGKIGGRAWLFDSAARPTFADLFDTPALFDSAGDPGLASIAVARVDDARPAHGLEDAFPGQARWPRPALGGGGLGGLLGPGVFVGVQATLWQLDGGTTCEIEGAAGLVRLPVDSACRFLNRCEKADARTKCGHRLGGLKVEPDARFDRMSVRADGADPAFVVRDYDSGRLRAAGAPTAGARQWLPELCVGDLCARDAIGHHDPLLVYDAKNHRLIEAFTSWETLAPGAFRLGPG